MGSARLQQHTGRARHKCQRATAAEGDGRGDMRSDDVEVLMELAQCAGALCAGTMAGTKQPQPSTLLS